jgi:Cell-cycle sustaining, positive selection,
MCSSLLLSFRLHRDFSKVDMPMVAKITKGQHCGILGVPSLSSPNLCNTALFLNAGKNFQIVAQPIKIKEGKKTSSVGSKVILIPDSYNGYFELLSEEGRSTKPFENVLELSRRRNVREKVIVRESFVIRSNNASIKTLNAGEILTPLNDDGKFLQCKTSKNQIISLPLDCKAKFSPLAKKEDSISGVHTVIKI